MSDQGPAKPRKRRRRALRVPVDEVPRPGAATEASVEGDATVEMPAFIEIAVPAPGAGAGRAVDEPTASTPRADEDGSAVSPSAARADSRQSASAQSVEPEAGAEELPSVSVEIELDADDDEEETVPSADAIDTETQATSTGGSSEDTVADEASEASPEEKSEGAADARDASGGDAAISEEAKDAEEDAPSAKGESSSTAAAAEVKEDSGEGDSGEGDSGEGDSGEGDSGEGDDTERAAGAASRSGRRAAGASRSSDNVASSKGAVRLPRRPRSSSEVVVQRVVTVSSPSISIAEIEQSARKEAVGGDAEEREAESAKEASLDLDEPALTVDIAEDDELDDTAFEEVASEDDVEVDIDEDLAEEEVLIEEGDEDVPRGDDEDGDEAEITVEEGELLDDEELLEEEDADGSAEAQGGAPKKPPPPPPSGKGPSSLPPPAPRGAKAPPAPTDGDGKPAGDRVSAPPQGRKKKARRAWFEHLFTDEYLRTVPIPQPKTIQRQCDFIEQRFGLARGATILDVGCGLGLHAIELTRRGYVVVGLDLSLPMLSRAADEADADEIDINFLHADMREMSFEGAFDAILCWNTTFGYFDDETNRQVVQRLYRALKPRGLLLLDVVNRDYVLQGQPNLVWFEGDGCVVMEETQMNFITSRLEVKRNVILDDGRQRDSRYSVRLYSLHELGQILHHQGFRVVELTGREAHPRVFFGAASPKLIILAERRAQVPSPPSGQPSAAQPSKGPPPPTPAAEEPSVEVEIDDEPSQEILLETGPTTDIEVDTVDGDGVSDESE